MEQKKTNIAIAADVTTKAELLQIAEEVGSQICLLKTRTSMSPHSSALQGVLTSIFRRRYDRGFRSLAPGTAGGHSA